jgi:hypothetical protein
MANEPLGPDAEYFRSLGTRNSASNSLAALTEDCEASPFSDGPADWPDGPFPTYESCPQTMIWTSFYEPD